MKITFENDVNQFLDKYLDEIGKIRLLTPEEEITLARQAKKGDQQAFRRLIEANLRFVISIAKHYQNRGISLGDLINEGNLGLIKAAKRFDETRGFRFISYAVWWIRQRIIQALAEQSLIVRLPLNRVNALNKIKKAYSILEQELEREPYSNEIARELNMSDSEVNDTISASKSQLSMDSPLAHHEENNLLDLIENNQELPPDSDLMTESLKVELKHAISNLTKREAEIIRLYFGLGHEPPQTLEQIGERFNLTRERIRQIKEKALQRLRCASNLKNLQPLTG